MNTYASTGLLITGSKPSLIKEAEQGLVVQQASISLDQDMINKIKNACLISYSFTEALKRVEGDRTTSNQVKEIIRNTLADVPAEGLQIDGEYFKKHVGRLYEAYNTLALLPPVQRRVLFSAFCAVCASDSAHCDCIVDEGEK